MEENRELEFPAFPYEPYSIQLDFMKFLYRSLDRGGISMLESPTGTGKTLSMICSALQWLVDRKKLGSLGKNGKESSGGGTEDDDEPDWMRNFVPNKEPDLAERKNLMQKKKNGVRSKGKEEIVRDLFSASAGEDRGEKANDKEVRNARGKIGVDEVDDDEFLLEEYDSEGENGGKLKRKDVGANDVFTSEEEVEEEGLGEEEVEAQLKIYFCSRTHSQLSQFMKELRKTKFASELKVVCLGSRKNFCINEDVLKLGNATRINERCLELQKSKKNEVSKMKKLGAGKRVRGSKSSSGCPMLRRRKIEELRNEIIQLEALDIEDLVQIGRNLGSCPYYGSRRMVHMADLVVLPYQSLLSKSSRESLGLNLKDSVIIIDEAHNLADTLISMYDAKITVSQLNQLQTHLNGYFRRFRNLLGPGNRRYIQTLIILTRAFLQMLSDDRKVVNPTDTPCDADEIKNSSSSTMTINEFLFALNIDNINLVKLLQYMTESNIIHKVSGYGDKVAISQKVVAVGDDEVVSEEESAVSGFRALADILSSLTNNDTDGRIIVSRAKQTCSGLEGHIKYVMLNGEKIFSEVVDQAHAVILAGGTLQPIEETKERLFPSLQLDRLPFFSCGHIIPSENILPVVVKHGPSGRSFDFSYKSRRSSTMIEELGLLLSNLVTVVPEGVVVFFSSFDYESLVHDTWKASGILFRIMKKKRIFREPRKTTDVEAVLREYKETIDALSMGDPMGCNGAILFAVVGGKISEGINFSDGAGRCIVMVGLPYPSPSDIELIERVKHIEGLEKTILGKNLNASTDAECHNGDVEAGFQILKSCKGRGKEYYENLCMKAVNQSIGRAIRHVNDYAAILLVDARYASDSTKRSCSHSTDKLPQWIKSRLVATTPNYGEVHRLLRQFFKSHKKKEATDKDFNSKK
ncbi:ATP-dependent DNA helicase DDX11 [Sesamum alatum]|uniref:ATP-dependent DNA helicase DDX11 n=1 Tax=Sesamum alatum TaxID=300844 RepID=A0AAE1YD50_9LAMI|nr:ATP-dependent DNA helicase DDX11 [Sesamum alatum]